jgi:hypothetical protein
MTIFTKAPRDAGTVSFDLRLFKVVNKKGHIGNLCLTDEPRRNTVFFRDFQHLEQLVKQLMRGK